MPSARSATSSTSARTAARRPADAQRSSPSRPGSARGEIAPERVGAARGDGAAQLARPPALAAELRAPGPEPPRREMQRVLVGEADGAVGLLRHAPRRSRIAPQTHGAIGFTYEHSLHFATR